MKRIQKGFTLIELMIVVAIVGILAAIALPAYQDYIVRSKVSEVAAAVGACKTSIAEWTATNGSLPPDSNRGGCSNTGSQYVVAADAWNGARIAYGAQNTGAVGGECTLTLTPSGVTNRQIATWTGGYSGCSAKYVPASFRQS